MNITAYCLCGETLTWEQLVNGSWVDISNNFSQVDAQTWDFTPTQQQINAGSIEIRYCCDAECSNTAVVTFEGGNDPCVATSDPVDWSGQIGDIVDLQAGSCDPCEGDWQQLINGTWTNQPNPNGQPLVSSMLGDWRICCDPGVSYSNSAEIALDGVCVPEPNIFGPGTYTFTEGEVMSFPFECTDCPQNVFLVWQQLNGGFYGAPPVLNTPDGEVATQAYQGSCWRFGCFDTANPPNGGWSSTLASECFNIQIIPAGGNDNVARTDADGVHNANSSDPVEEQFCLDQCAPGAVYRWQMRIEQAGPLTAPQLDANDPALTGAWFDVPEFDGMQCVDLEIRHEDLPNGNNATDLTLHDDLDETFYFEIRGSCDADGTYSAAQPVTIIYDHADEGIL